MKLFRTGFNLLFLLVLLAPCQQALAQQSLAIGSSPDTAKRIEYLHQLASENMKQHPKRARVLCEKAEKLAKSVNNKQAQAEAFSKIGISYRIQSLYKLAIENQLRAYRIYEELGNKEAIAKTHNEIGMIYWQQKDLEKAIKHHEQALHIAEEIDSKEVTAFSYKNLGVVHFYKQEYEAALGFYDRALELAENSDQNKLLPALYNNIGIVHAHLNDYNKSLGFYQKALEINTQFNDLQLDAAIYDNMGDIYRLLGQYQKSQAFLEKGLQKAEEVHAVNRMIESQESLFQLYRKKGNYQKALSHLQSQIGLKDSFINVNNSRQIAELRANYESSKKDRDIKILKQSEELLQQQKKFNNLLLIASIVASIAILVIAAFVLNSQRLKLWKKKELLERQKQEHQIREALVQASLENEQLAKQSLEREVAYKNQRISAHALHIVQKQQFLEEMRDQVKSILDKPTSSQVKKLLKKIDQGMNMNQEWKQINQTLDQVNADFFTKLQTKCPALTPNELRVCLLAKLNFSIKEMAILLKIAPNSVAISRHRIRKKLNLPQEENFNRFMMNIS